MLAFSFEALLNYFGERRYSLWTMRKRIGPVEKLDTLSKHLGVDLPAIAEESHSRIEKLIKFRHQMAHGQSEQRVGRTTMNFDIGDAWPHLPEAFADWESYLRDVDDSASVCAVEEVAKLLSEAAGEGSFPFSYGVVQRSATLVVSPAIGTASSES